MNKYGVKQAIDFITEHCLNTLSEREKQIVSLRNKDVFGIGSNDKTMREIGNEQGVGQERIRQILAKATRKIAYRLRIIEQRMSDPHVIVKYLPPEPHEAAPVPNLPMRPVLVTSLGELSCRTHTCLKNSNLLLIENLTKKAGTELLRLPNFGRKSLLELQHLLAQYGLSLRPDHEYLLEEKYRKI